MYKYQNISKITQTITVSGNVTPRVVDAGGEVVVDFPLENPNFKYVGADQGEQSAAQPETKITEEIK